MAVAGGTAPSLLVNLDPGLGIIVIEHGENRLIRIQVDMVDDDGNVVLVTRGKRKGKPKQRMVPTGAVDLDLEEAKRKLLNGQRVWIKAEDRQRLATLTGLDTCPRPLISHRFGVNNE